MKLDNIRDIIEVSKYKSINKASQHLFVNQQQLSRVIAAAEEEVGVSIFERTAKGVRLTPEGKRVIKKFEEIIALYDSIGTDAISSAGCTGKIRILSDVNIWSGYAGLYTSFLKEQPGIRFFTESMSSEKIVAHLQANEGIGQISRVIWDGEEEFAIPAGLEYRKISKGRVEVYGHHSNPFFVKYKTISLGTLLDWPLVNYKPYGSGEATLEERIFKPVGMPNIRYEVNNYRVFEEIVRETDCLFLTMKKPSYIDGKNLIGIPLRDNIFLENGIVQNPQKTNDCYRVFEQFYIDYYQKLYEESASK